MGQNAARQCKQSDSGLEMAFINKTTDNITPCDYFNIFIKSSCACKPNLCHGNHLNAYTSHNCSNQIIYLQHKSNYSIGIINNHTHPILAVISVDNFYIGKF